MNRNIAEGCLCGMQGPEDWRNGCQLRKMDAEDVLELTHRNSIFMPSKPFHPFRFFNIPHPHLFISSPTRKVLPIPTNCQSKYLIRMAIHVNSSLLPLFLFWTNFMKCRKFFAGGQIPFDNRALLA